jgi:adenylosuccinate synthase
VHPDARQVELQLAHGVGKPPLARLLHRDVGAEFGATTGRPRRCGWLDLVALRYAVRINGLTGLALTKIDVLTGMDPIRVCVGYEHRGRRIDVPPYDDMEAVRPIYEDIGGWKEDLSGCRALEDLPAATRSYLDHIERVVECPIRLVSVGADRSHTISITHPFE